MKTKDAQSIESKHPISESVRKRNPHLYPDLLEPNMEKFVEQLAAAHPPPPKRQSKRIRQSSKPLMNKLETEYYHELLQKEVGEVGHVRVQAITFRLANGCKLTPDFTYTDKSPYALNAVDVKGEHAWEDSLIKLKFAATTYPEIRWFLVWKENGEWKSQEVLP